MGAIPLRPPAVGADSCNSRMGTTGYLSGQDVLGSQSHASHCFVHSSSSTVTALAINVRQLPNDDNRA
jgi:hypothetical protein